MRIVLVGESNRGSRTPQRLRALADLGHDVAFVSTTPEGWSYETPPDLIARARYRLRMPGDPAHANARLVEAAKRGCDAMILDNARMIRPSALREARAAAPSMRLIWYSEDDILNPVHRTRWLERAMPLFDLWVTTKSFNARPEEMAAFGVRRVLFVNNAFCPYDHAPLTVDAADRVKFGAPVSFVGTYETPRANDLLALARSGINVRVWGNGWQAMKNKDSSLEIMGHAIYGDDYRKVVCASDINLCFLRKGNRDLQTCRSMEIPAMGGFMMHEASQEMFTLLTPDHEAVYFRDSTELVTRTHAWLADSHGRHAVAEAGRSRILADDRSHQRQWRLILDNAGNSPCAF